MENNSEWVCEIPGTFETFAGYDSREEAEEAAVRLAETFGVNVREIIVREAE